MRVGSAIQVVLALILTCCVSSATAEETQKARFLGSFPWHMNKPWFGGWSGIELSPDGQRMTVITDRGHILKAGIERQGDQITGVATGRMWRLKASTGVYLTPRIKDSEGLALTADGSIIISFEGVARLSRYARPGVPAQVLRHHTAFREFPRNKSLEALAIDRNGRLFTIPELLTDTGKIRVFVYHNNTWSTPFTLNGGAGFLPVGADFGPDGRLYLLERAWSVLGFRARVRRWDITGDIPRAEELLLQTRFGTHDNLEGLAVWRDNLGRTRLTMIADNNFLLFQRTEIVEYAVQE